MTDDAMQEFEALLADYVEARIALRLIVVETVKQERLSPKAKGAQEDVAEAHAALLAFARERLAAPSEDAASVKRLADALEQAAYEQGVGAEDEPPHNAITTDVALSGAKLRARAALHDAIDRMAAAQAVRDDALETAWGLVANASGGDWSRESPEWQDAAARWRDEALPLWMPAAKARVVRSLTPAPATEDFDLGPVLAEYDEPPAPADATASTEGA